MLAIVRGRSPSARDAFRRERRVGGGRLDEAIVLVLEHHEIAGATVLSGVMGHGARAMQERIDRRAARQPLTPLLIENERKLRAARPTLMSMMTEGIFVMLEPEVIPLPDKGTREATNWLGVKAPVTWPRQGSGGARTNRTNPTLSAKSPSFVFNDLAAGVGACGATRSVFVKIFASALPLDRPV